MYIAVVLNTSGSPGRFVRTQISAPHPEFPTQQVCSGALEAALLPRVVGESQETGQMSSQRTRDKEESEEKRKKGVSEVKGLVQGRVHKKGLCQACAHRTGHRIQEARR